MEGKAMSTAKSAKAAEKPEAMVPSPLPEPIQAPCRMVDVEISMPAWLAERVEEIARVRGTTVAQIIVGALKCWI